MQSVRIPLAKITHWFESLYTESNEVTLHAYLKPEILQQLHHYGYHSWCFVGRKPDTEPVVSMAFRREDPITDEDVIMLILAV